MQKLILGPFSPALVLVVTVLLRERVNQAASTQSKCQTVGGDLSVACVEGKVAPSHFALLLIILYLPVCLVYLVHVHSTLCLFILVT